MEEAAVRRLAAALALVSVTACTGIKAQTATFANMEEAQPAIAAGYIPAGLPPSSFELRAAYLPDSWERWGIINFPASGAGVLRGLLQPEEISLTGIRCEIPGRIEWWPVQLRNNLDDERIKATGAKAYRSRTGNLLFVVNWAQGRAYYWSTG
jgi:hypothetical protein